MNRMHLRETGGIFLAKLTTPFPILWEERRRDFGFTKLSVG